jgi:hypothetical protein
MHVARGVSRLAREEVLHRRLNATLPHPPGDGSVRPRATVAGAARPEQQPRSSSLVLMLSDSEAEASSLASTFTTAALAIPWPSDPTKYAPGEAPSPLSDLATSGARASGRRIARKATDDDLGPLLPLDDDPRSRAAFLSSRSSSVGIVSDVGDTSLRPCWDRSLRGRGGGLGVSD